MGGTLPDVGDSLPEGWPNPRFAPEFLPVIYVYGHTKEEMLRQRGFSEKSSLPVGTLGDIRCWIEDSRNQERFIFTTAIIGLLSIAVIILDITKRQ